LEEKSLYRILYDVRCTRETMSRKNCFCRFKPAIDLYIVPNLFSDLELEFLWARRLMWGAVTSRAACTPSSCACQMQRAANYHAQLSQTDVMPERVEVQCSVAVAASKVLRRHETEVV
jgi:hypothetical protein